MLLLKVTILVVVLQLISFCNWVFFFFSSYNYVYECRILCVMMLVLYYALLISSTESLNLVPEFGKDYEFPLSEINRRNYWLQLGRSFWVGYVASSNLSPNILEVSHMNSEIFCIREFVQFNLIHLFEFDLVYVIVRLQQLNCLGLFFWKLMLQCSYFNRRQIEFWHCAFSVVGSLIHFDEV